MLAKSTFLQRLINEDLLLIFTLDFVVYLQKDLLKLLDLDMN